MNDTNKLKDEVKNYWNEQACGTQFTNKEKFTKEYFEEIEQKRYAKEPEIFSFAQFTRYHGKKLLEVGMGAGTDFLQWVRAGTEAYGLDLTPEAADHIRHRLSVYGLEAKDIKVGDSERLPYSDNQFDIVYSWGVIHHTPDTEQALHEIIRVCKPGGTVKVMVYHRRSLLAWFFWIKHALLRLKPFKSVTKVLWDHMESIGTKAFTKKEIRQMLKDQPVVNVKLSPVLSYYDRLKRFNKLFQLVAKFAAWILGKDKVGWFLTIELNKK